MLERKKAADSGKGKGKPLPLPRRIWSLRVQLYRKNRSRLGLLRAKKLVFVSSAIKVKQKDLRSMEEKELELPCTSVNEESFGSALADCVLV